jgi:hypothetical protein
LDPLGFPEDSLKLIQANSDISHSEPDVILTTPNFYETLRSHYPVNELKRVILDEGDMIAFDGFSSFLGALKGAVSEHQVSFFSASLSSQDIKKVKQTFQIAVLADVRDKQIANSTVSPSSHQLPRSGDQGSLGRFPETEERHPQSHRLRLEERGNLSFGRLSYRKRRFPSWNFTATWRNGKSPATSMPSMPKSEGLLGCFRLCRPRH